MRPHRAHKWHNVQFIAGTYVSEMQLWFVTVSSNELDQCAIWDTRRLDAVHDTNGLAAFSYLFNSAVFFISVYVVCFMCMSMDLSCLK